MTQTRLEAFQADARAQGFDEIVERNWAPSTVVESHTHPFAVRALIVRGEMWLTVGHDVRHLRPGDEFALTSIKGRGPVHAYPPEL